MDLGVASGRVQLNDNSVGVAGGTWHRVLGGFQIYLDTDHIVLSVVSWFLKFAEINIGIRKLAPLTSAIVL